MGGVELSKTEPFPRTRSSPLDLRWPCGAVSPYVQLRATRRAAPCMANAAEICNRALNIALSHRDCWMWDETRRVMLCLPALECAVRGARSRFFSTCIPTNLRDDAGRWSFCSPRAQLCIPQMHQLSSVESKIPKLQSTDIRYLFCLDAMFARTNFKWCVF
jgi:hypothetical protein